ncbi:CD63 antigen [Ooceraea biroi]|uniref:CD63 antigen n=1 Tax=Ooceraea biroi TaxID=2015173 RepID=A0A026WQL6_OOCBI|nr:CD63 antigen [Ooceraea biroi]
MHRSINVVIKEEKKNFRIPLPFAKTQDKRAFVPVFTLKRYAAGNEAKFAEFIEGSPSRIYVPSLAINVAYRQRLLAKLCSLIILVVAAIILRDFRGIMSRMSGLRILNIMDFEAFPISFLVISSFMIVVASCAFGIALFFFQDRRFRARVTTKIHYVIFTFTLLLLIILISQIATAIYGVSVLPKKGFKSHLNFKESFMNYNIRMEDTYYVDFVQRTLHCCGIYSTYDYELILGIPIPQTCCPESGWICHQYNAYHNGCELELRFFYSSMYRNLSVLSFTAFGFAPVVVAALIAAVVLLISVRYSQEYLHAWTYTGEIAVEIVKVAIRNMKHSGTSIDYK